MAIRSAILGAEVSASEINTSGADYNDLVKRGIITPTQGGQAGKFTQDWYSPNIPTSYTPPSAPIPGSAPTSIPAPVPGSTPASAGANSGNVYDIAGIFQQKAGRLPTAEETQQLQGILANQPNTALGVSAIQQAGLNALNGMPAGGTPASPAGGLPGNAPTGGDANAPSLPSYATSEDVGTWLKNYNDTISGMATEGSAAGDANIKAQFQPLIEAAQQEGKKALGGVEAISNRMGGMGASAVKEGLIHEQEITNKKVISDLMGQMSKAITDNDSKSYDRAKESYDKALDVQDKIFKSKLDLANYNLDALTKQGTMDINTANAAAKTPQGESFFVNGKLVEGTKPVAPFYTGTNLIELMKTLPMGQSTTMTDPNTQMQFEITGIGDNTQNKTYEVTAADGTVRFVTTDKGGNIVQTVNAGKIGKGFKTGTGTGTGTSNTLFGKKIDQRTPLYDQASGKYVADEITFKDGSKTFVNTTGNMELNFDPSNTRRGNPLKVDTGTGSKLTDSQLSKIATKGISNDAANWISEQQGAGASDEEIISGLTSSGYSNAQSMLEGYKSTLLFGF